MGTVYRSAKQVIVWLGPAKREEVTRAYKHILSTTHLNWPEDWQTKDQRGNVDAILPILERPWFRRLWVIQEAVLGKDVLVLYDRLHPVTLVHFTHCVYAIWRYCTSVSAVELDHPVQRSLRCISRLLAIREQYIAQGAESFELLLQAGRCCEIKDPRDVIFGIQAIAGRRPGVPLPEYGVPLADILCGSSALAELHTKTSRALLCHGTSLDALALAGLAGQGYEGLPSWMLNLQGAEESEPLTLANAAGWDAGGPLASRTREHSALQLLMEVNMLDEIIVCCRPFDFDDIRDLHDCIEEITGLARFTSRSSVPGGVRGSWKEAIMTSLTFGLNVGDEPMTPRDARDFDQWLQMMSSKRAHGDPTWLHTNAFHRTACIRVEGWRACLTKGGGLCVAPPTVLEGDRVCIVPGCRFPVVLRVIGGREGNAAAQDVNSYVLVSWCYDDGWMHGERRGDESRKEDIVLS